MKLHARWVLRTSIISAEGSEGRGLPAALSQASAGVWHYGNLSRVHACVGRDADGGPGSR